MYSYTVSFIIKIHIDHSFIIKIHIEYSFIIKIHIDHTRLTHGYLPSQKSPPLCDICNIHLIITHIFFEYRKPLCDICNIHLSITHIFFECRKFTTIRVKFHIPFHQSSLMDSCQIEYILSF